MPFPNEDTQFKPGESGNPAGREKGSKNLPSIIRDLMENVPDWDKVNIKDVQKLKERYKNNTAGEALIYVALTKAIAGDINAMRWLSKTGYGDKVTFDGSLKHEGVVIYKPEKYPRLDERPAPIEATVVTKPTEQPLPPQPTAPLPAPNPDLDGIA